MNPFEYAKDLMIKTEHDDTIAERKDYKKFLINRTLSYHSDLIFYANAVNEYPDMDNQYHYSFLHRTIPKKTRPYKGWLKSKKLEDLDVVKEYFKYSNSKATQALSVLSEENVEYMRKKLDKGGM